MTNEHKVYYANIDEDGLLQLHPELIEELGWKEGDELRWVESDTSSCIILVNLTAEIRKFAHNPDNYPGEPHANANSEVDQREVDQEVDG